MVKWVYAEATSDSKKLGQSAVFLNQTLLMNRNGNGRVKI